MGFCTKCPYCFSEVFLVVRPLAKKFGKLLQVGALALLPVTMLMELNGGLGRTHGLATMLWLLLLGVGLFSVGRLIEGYATV